MKLYMMTVRGSFDIRRAFMQTEVVARYKAPLVHPFVNSGIIHGKLPLLCDLNSQRISAHSEAGCTAELDWYVHSHSTTIASESTREDIEAPIAWPI